MNHQELSGYENEPVEHFLPLPNGLYCQFYDLEMGTRLEDCHYYSDFLRQNNCRSIVELGCGTGRIIDFLTLQGFLAIGIDTSADMLRYNRGLRTAPVAEMDMRCLGFRPAFDAAIIAHNTLNLLGQKTAIMSCLQGVRQSLAPGGWLIVHLFALTTELSSHPHKRIFQFSLHDTPENGKLVKESIRTYLPETDHLQLVERYKIRSFDAPALNENYQQTLLLAAYSASEWIELIQTSGFTIASMRSAPDIESFNRDTDSTLIIAAQSQ